MFQLQSTLNGSWKKIAPFSVYKDKDCVSGVFGVQFLQI